MERSNKNSNRAVKSFLHTMFNGFHLVGAGIVIFLSGLLFAGIMGCAPGTAHVVSGNNLVPVIMSIAPTQVQVNSGATTLTITGTGFVPTTSVTVGGVAAPATYVSSTQLTAAITSTMAGTAGQFSTIVSNPAPGGGLSNVLNFTVANPAPTITSLSPTNFQESASNATLTIDGTGFDSSTQVNIGGTTAAYTLVNSTEITTTVPASLLAQDGSYSVTVYNPSPGGGTSNIVGFTVGDVQNPVPTIAQVSPTYYPVNASPATITINGTGFVAGSVVTVGGNVAVSTLVSSTQLTATVPSANLATAGVVPVVVTNLSPGGGTSNAVGLGIGAERPRMSD